jgi:hypothetical protein
MTIAAYKAMRQMTVAMAPIGHSHGGDVSRETFAGVADVAVSRVPVIASIWSGSRPRIWVPDLSHGGWVPQRRQVGL